MLYRHLWPEVAQALELAFPVLVERLEKLLRSGELDPRRQHSVAVQHAGLPVKPIRWAVLAMCISQSIKRHGHPLQSDNQP